MANRTIQIPDRVLNRATDALRLAAELLPDLDAGRHLTIDFRAASRMTPSYANALMMTLLAERPKEELQRLVRIETSAANVAAALRRSVERYERGVRLSSQSA